MNKKSLFIYNQLIFFPLKYLFFRLDNWQCFFYNYPYSVNAKKMVINYYCDSNKYISAYAFGLVN